MEGKDDKATDEHSGVGTDEHSGGELTDDLVLRLILLVLSNIQSSIAFCPFQFSKGGPSTRMRKR